IITSIEYSSMQMNYPRMVGKNAVKDKHGRGPNLHVVILSTDKGAQGFAQVRGDMKDIRTKAALLKGKRITDVFNLSTGITTNDAFYFDLALHDLVGNILGIPCY